MKKLTIVSVIVLVLLIRIISAGVIELSRDVPDVKDEGLNRLELCNYTTKYKILKNAIINPLGDVLLKMKFSNGRVKLIKMDELTDDWTADVSRNEARFIKELSETCKPIKKIPIIGEIDDGEVKLR